MGLCVFSCATRTVLLNAALFSHNMPVDPSSGTLNMRKLYRNAMTNSTVSLSAVNSDPKVDVSSEFCFLLSHITGARLQNINMPIFDRIVNLSDA